MTVCPIVIGCAIEAQLLTCMKLAGIKTGWLINVNVNELEDEIKRYVF